MTEENQLENFCVVRAGRGRPKGSTGKNGASFVTVPLESLIKKFADMQQPIVVSRKWAEFIRLEGTLVGKTQQKESEQNESETLSALNLNVIEN